MPDELKLREFGSKVLQDRADALESELARTRALLRVAQREEESRERVRQLVARLDDKATAGQG